MKIYAFIIYVCEMLEIILLMALILTLTCNWFPFLLCIILEMMVCIEELLYSFIFMLEVYVLMLLGA